MKVFILITFAFCVSSAYKRRVCRETIKIQDREEMADVIFTGTVRRIYRQGLDKSRTYNAVVQLKNVLKCKMDTIFENFIIVSGFGNKQMCDSDIKERDTRIFLVGNVDINYFKLNSSLLRVSSENLDLIAASVNGK